MTAKDGWRDLVRGALLDNLGLKVLSLVVALGFYAFIHGAENAQRTFRVSVVSIMPPESQNRQIMVQVPTEVAVTLRGSRTHLDDLRADDLGSLQLDLRSGRETRVDLDPSMFHIPPNLTVEQIYPSSIELRWDDVVGRQIPIQISRTGDPAPGFTVKGVITVDPPVVNARGPRSVVDVMQFARAAPFDVSGLSEGTYRRPLALDKPPKLVSYDVETVTAALEIARELHNKEFPGLRVEVVGLPRATTSPPTVNVSIRGTAEDVSALYKEAIIPRVEPKTTGLDLSVPGSAYLDVLVDVPKPKVDGQPPRIEVNPSKVLVKW
jgi:YbbR domain-containing protein